MPTDVTLDFSSAISTTLLDKDAQGTGFTSVQPNTADNAYDLGHVDLNTSASSLYPQPPTQADGNIQVLTPHADIVQNRMVFSTVNEEVRAPKTLTLLNTGTGTLTITGLSFGNSLELDNVVRSADQQRAADFKLVNAPTLPITLAANASLNLSVQFAPQRIASVSTSTTDTLNGENYASLTITSNDPDQPTRSVNLAGLNSADYEGNNEPSLAEFARTFGWSLNVGTEKQSLGGTKTLLGDEVYSPYWLRADTTKPVLLWPLAVYSGRGNNPHGGVRFEAKAGSGGNSGSLYELAGRNNGDGVLGSNDLSGGENQKLLPKILVNNVNSVPTSDSVDFVPTQAFALNMGGTWTDDAKNGTGQLHNWRMFPVRDAKGTLVPNTWYATEDIGNTEGGSKNYDYQDAVYLLVNAKPESAALDPSVPGPLPGAPSLVFDFNQTYAGSLNDKDGETIGFTSTQLNKNDTFTSKTSYSPNLLDINTGGAGTLSLTTTTGSNGSSDNTLENGLLTTFDGRAGKSIISTGLVGPLNNMTAPYQQGGVMFGPNQDNFIKLVAIAQPGGTLGLQFYSENKGVGTTIGPIVPISSPSTLQSLELRLLTDPQAGTLQAAYRAIYPTSDTGMVMLPNSVVLKGDQGHYFAAQSKAGIITTSKNGPSPINVTFDRFAITPG